MVALILSIVGGINAGNATSQDKLNSALSLRHIGSILFIVLYGLVVLLHVYFWTQKALILKHRQMVRVQVIPLIVITASKHAP